MTLPAALVTGAGRGIGAGVAAELARRGHPVALVARSASQLELTASLIAAAGGRAMAATCDVGDRTQVVATRRAVEDAIGPIGILVNNAAVLGPLAPIWQTDPDEVELTMRSGLVGAYNVLREVLPGMIERRWGRVVAVSSSSAVHAFGGMSAYCATKAGFEHLHRVAAIDTVGAGVLVNIVWPGGVATLMQEQLAANAGVDVPPMATPADVAPVIADLCAVDLTVTGTLVDVDRLP